MAKGMVLVEFDEWVRRKGDRTESQKFQEKMKDVTDWLRQPTGEWPPEVSVGGIREVTRFYGGPHTPNFNVLVELNVGNPDTPPTDPERETLRKACKLIERHCHVEGYA